MSGIAAGGGPAGRTVPPDAEVAADMAERTTPAGARVQAVFMLHGEAQQIAARAEGLLDRLQEVALACEGECDLDVSLDIQVPWC